MRSTRITGDRIIAAVIFVFSLNLLIVSLRYGLFVDHHVPGPGLFPAFITAPLVLLSIAWMIVGDRHPTKPKSEEQEDLNELVLESENLMEEMAEIDSSGKRRIIYVIAWSFAWTVTLERIGIILAMTIYVMGMLYSCAQIKPWRSLLPTLLIVFFMTWGALKMGIILPDPFHLLKIIGH